MQIMHWEIPDFLTFLRLVLSHIKTVFSLVHLTYGINWTMIHRIFHLYHYLRKNWTKTLSNHPLIFVLVTVGLILFTANFVMKLATLIIICLCRICPTVPSVHVVILWRTAFIIFMSVPSIWDTVLSYLKIYKSLLAI